MLLRRRTFLASTAATLAATKARAGLGFGVFDLGQPGGPQWQPLAIGAGGYISGADITPSGSIVCRTDTYGAYAFNRNTQSWSDLITAQSILPTMSSLGVSGLNPSGTCAAAGAGGQQFAPMGLAQAPTNPSVMYMIVYGRLFVSTNAGATWTLNSGFPAATQPSGTPLGGDIYRYCQKNIAVDPQNANVVFASHHSAFRRSVDGGSNWTDMLVSGGGTFPNSTTSIAGGDTVPAYGICFDTSQGTTTVLGVTVTKVIYAMSFGNGVQVTNDGGTTWHGVSTTGSPPTFATDAVIGINTGTTGTSYYVVGSVAATYDNPDSQELSVYRLQSVTPGTAGTGTWATLTVGAWASGSGIGHSLDIDPNHPTHLVIVDITKTQLAHCNDANTTTGSSIVKMNCGVNPPNDIPWLVDFPTPVTSRVFFDPTTGTSGGNTRLLLSCGIGMFYTDDLSTTSPANTAISWHSFSKGIEQLVATSVVSPPTSLGGGGYPVLGTWDQINFTSVNPHTFPVSGHGVAKPSAQVMVCGECDYAKDNSSYVVALNQFFGFEVSGYSLTSGVAGSWVQFTNPPTTSTGYCGSIQVGSAGATPATTANIVHYDGKICYSTNGGGTWTLATGGPSDTANPPNPQHPRRRIMKADTVNLGYFYCVALDGKLYRSTNGGANWTAFTPTTSFGTINADTATLVHAPGQTGDLFFCQGFGTVNPITTNQLWKIQGAHTGTPTGWTAVPNVWGVVVCGFGGIASGASYPRLWINGFNSVTYAGSLSLTGTGSFSFNIGAGNAGIYVAGRCFTMINTASGAFATGLITSYDNIGGTLVLNILAYSGNTTQTGWQVGVYGIWYSDNANLATPTWTFSTDFPFGSFDFIYDISGDLNDPTKCYVGFEGKGFGYFGL